MDYNYHLLLLGRLGLSVLLGGIIGYERQSRNKAAGLRTNSLVCLGACLIMVLSQALYLEVEGHTNADPARLAAQVVSGIGFLGAGAIMKEGANVTGLTTAACLWVVAGVGLAVGAGHYAAALFTTLMVFTALEVLSRLEKLHRHQQAITLRIKADDRTGQVSLISACLNELGLKTVAIRVASTTATPEDRPHDIISLDIEIKNFPKANDLEIMNTIQHLDGVISVKVI